MDSVLALLDRLEAVILRVGQGPPADRKPIDQKEALDLLRMVRARLPQDLHHAQRLREEAEGLHERAADHARRIIMEAEAHARRLESHDTVLAEAAEHRRRILADAEVEARRIREGADAYAAQVLADLERDMLRILAAIQRGRASLAPRE